jgi:hypothetical protein
MSILNVSERFASPLGKGERTRVRGSAEVVAKSTEPSPYPLPWEGRGGGLGGKPLRKRVGNSR